jgi:hypothetical protein
MNLMSDGSGQGTRLKIYLATPYSSRVRGIKEARFHRVNRVAGEIMQLGHTVFSPISHSHPIANDCALPLELGFWLRQDMPFIEWCDELWVYTDHGWQESEGIKAEIKYASSLGKPIKEYNRGGVNLLDPTGYNTKRDNDWPNPEGC